MSLTFTLRKAVSLASVIFGACFILLLSLGFLVFSHFKSLKNYNHQAVRAYTVMSQITRAESLLKDAENGTRAFLVTGDSVFLRPFLNTPRLLIPALDSLQRLVRNNAMQTKDFHNAEKLAFLELKVSDSLIRVSNTVKEGKDSLVKSLMFRSRSIMQAYGVATKHMINIETDQLTYRKKQIGYYQSKLANNFTLLFASGLLIIILLGAWAFIEFKKRVRYQTSLEENIITLNQNNAELEQIAFAASHDLQEPLRKIRIFSDRLRTMTQHKTEDEHAIMIEKINRSAIQLHGLIADLVDLTNIVQSRRVFEMVSLSEVLEKSKSCFKSEINDSCCKIIAGDLPMVRGAADQLQRLFNNLFSNSFAFRSPERIPVIIISSETIKSDAVKNLPPQSAYREYCHVKFQDNGIGFDDSFREKLFMPFQRLHNYAKDDVRRKGMGLAICKRIMVNHNGWIDGEGNEGAGAVIHLYFPVMMQ